MGVGEVVGGAALVGVAALLGLSWTADETDDSQSAPTTTIFVWDSTTTSLAPSTSTPSSDVAPLTSLPSAGSEPTQSTASETTTESAPVTTPPGTDPAPVTTAPPVATLAPVDPASVAVQVVNGSGEDGAASFITGVLRVAGFAPLEPADAVQPISTPQGVVFHAVGQEAAAQAVAAALSYSPQQVIPAPIADPNWVQFNSGLQVLVVVGP